MMAAIEKQLVSVILPVYNGGAFLGQSIRSVLNQSHRHFELLVINDGSTDDTAAVAHQFHDKRIIYLENETNKGLVFSLNRGLELAKGALIARLDADDYCHPRRLELQVQAFGSDPALVIAGTHYHEKGKTTWWQFSQPADSDYLKSLLLFNTCFNHSTVMMRRSVYLHYHAEFRHVEDYKLWTDLATHGKFALIRKKLLTYRYHPKQVTSQHRKEQLELSARIRASFLRSMAFSFSPAELEIHNLVGDHIRLSDRARLDEAEKWMLSLVSQNSRNRAFQPESFHAMIGRQWADTCGNTTLGLYAYRKAVSSPLWDLYNAGLSQKMFLAAKCVLRRWSSPHR
jgi:glycosyltransferase involved in cell wall biosynthesis